MELSTRFGNYGDFLEVKTDEIKTDVWKNGNESNELMQNLLSVLEDLSKLRDETIFEYLENHYSITITQAD